jgi:hypothetical protein
MSHRAKGRPILDGYLSEQALGDEIGRSVVLLRLWRRKGSGPPFIRIGRTPYYNIEAVRRWIAAQERQQPKAA